MIDTPTPTTWNEASWTVLAHLAGTNSHLHHLEDTDARLVELRSRQLEIAETLNHLSEASYSGIPRGGFTESLLVEAMCDAGRIAIGHAKDLEDCTFDYAALHGLLCKKQHDYGHENINMFGILGVCIRLCDKIARLLNLYATDTDPNNESVDDTWSDIVGYAVIAKMLQQDWFKLHLTEDFNEPF